MGSIRHLVIYHILRTYHANTPWYAALAARRTAGWIQDRCDGLRLCPWHLSGLLQRHLSACVDCRRSLRSTIRRSWWPHRATNIRKAVRSAQFSLLCTNSLEQSASTPSVRRHQPSAVHQWSEDSTVRPCLLARGAFENIRLESAI